MKVTLIATAKVDYWHRHNLPFVVSSTQKLLDGREMESLEMTLEINSEIFLDASFTYSSILCLSCLFPNATTLDMAYNITNHCFNQ